MGNWPQKVSVSTKEPSQTFSPLQLVKVFTVWLSDKAMRQLVERMNQSQVFFDKLWEVCLWGSLNKESILVRHGCWHFVLVNRLLTIHAYHYNRKLQPRICRVMDINEVKSGKFSAAKPISSHKYFSENQMDKHDKRLYKGRDFYFRDLLWPNAMCWMGI